MERGKVIFENGTPAYLKLRYPSAHLKDVVEYYFEIDGPAVQNHSFSIVALPSLNTVMAIPLTDTEKSCYHHFSGRVFRLSGPKILGNLTRAITCTYAHNAHEFSIKFKPGILQHLLSVNAHGLVDSHLELQGHFPGTLIEKIMNSSGFTARINIIEAYLSARSDQFYTDKKLNLVRKALDFMVNATQDDRISAVSGQVAVSAPTLNRYFKATLDLSPKQCLKILRFKTGLKHYHLHGSAYVYDEIGYTDFSHFVKDAKGLTNTVPSAL